MGRERGKDGRFSSRPEQEPKEGEKAAPMRAARLRHCRKVLVYKVAEAMPNIVDALIEGSNKGSFEHTKELLKLAHATQEKKEAMEAPVRRESGIPGLMLEKIRRARVAEPDRASSDALDDANDR